MRDAKREREKESSFIEHVYSYCCSRLSKSSSTLALPYECHGVAPTFRNDYVITAYYNALATTTSPLLVLKKG